MSKYSLFKGLVIGSIFSAIFWLGTYFAITSFSKTDSDIKNTVPSTEIIEVKASF